MNTWVDGRPATTIPVTDRGLQFGDGLFETLAVVDGRVLWFERHLQRLAAGCLRLGLSMPDARLLAGELTAAAAGLERAVMKLLVTRGDGGRGYRPPVGGGSRRILCLREWPNGLRRHAGQGLRLDFAATRLADQPLLAGLKHLGRQEQVLASLEPQWQGDRVDELLMCDGQDRVVEGTRSNLFVVEADRLLTPGLERNGVAGIMRGLVMEAAVREEIRVVETDLARDRLGNARELMVCNAVMGLQGVTALASRPLASGTITRRLQARLVAMEDRLACDAG
ncbi:MAG: aminodeoxychorismate lyase [Gammaproteobacteria bacterium]|jgi:4-amino-4-deoxychorismate lyase